MDLSRTSGLRGMSYNVRHMNDCRKQSYVLSHRHREKKYALWDTLLSLHMVRSEKNTYKIRSTLKLFHRKFCQVTKNRVLR